mgnify:CR=1 FL=1
MDEKENQPKIDLVEGIFVTLCLLALEFADVIPLVGSGFATVVFGAYLWFRGLLQMNKIVVNAITNLIEFLALGINWLPLRTFGFIITWYLDAHPKMAAAAMKGAALTAAVGATVATGGAAAPVAGAAAAGGTAATTATAGTATMAATTAGEVSGAATTGSRVIPSIDKATKRVPDGAFGEEKDPLKKVADSMSDMPSIEKKGDEDAELEEAA